MLDFKINRDPETHEYYIETTISGKQLLTVPQLNKGTAFSAEERFEFGLLGKLPHRIETLSEQVSRAYIQYRSYQESLHRHIYLNNLHDKNQILFYRLVSLHLEEMLPIIYTPVVGKAVQNFNREYRQPRGLYITHLDIEKLNLILSNRSDRSVDIIVVTDGEGVLGIGDQGIGGMDIPVAKLMVYSLCGGIDPTRSLPIFLDVGTNNEELLKDPLYLGCRHPRLSGADYDQFIHHFVSAIKENFPQAFLHWEDLGRNNASRILNLYQNEICTFNDDIQGTGAVTLAALLSACDLTKTILTQHRIILFGAGSAGTGICEQLADAMEHFGLSKAEALSLFWLIDKDGLLFSDDPSLTPSQIPFARSPAERKNFADDPHQPISLLDTIHAIKPSILIGCSSQAGAFNEEIIRTMTSYCPEPIVFPLSNPDEKCEAKPEDILIWSNYKALIATGTAFPEVPSPFGQIQIAQCNNALIFPGLGLGILAVQAKRMTKSMLWAAANALAHLAPCKTEVQGPLLPLLNDAQKVAKIVALAVAETAREENLATINQEGDLDELINRLFWEPQYLSFRKPKTETSENSRG